MNSDACELGRLRFTASRWPGIGIVATAFLLSACGASGPSPEVVAYNTGVIAESCRRLDAAILTLPSDLRSDPYLSLANGWFTVRSMGYEVADVAVAAEMLQSSSARDLAEAVSALPGAVGTWLVYQVRPSDWDSQTIDDALTKMTSAVRLVHDGCKRFI